MERIKTYLCAIHVPSLHDIRSGEYFRRFFKPLDTTDDTYLHNFENTLLSLQEVLIWTDVKKSLLWLFVSQLFLYQFCISSTPIISSTAYVCLISYLYLTWTHKIWPTIRLPPEVPEDTETWTPVHPNTLSAPEIENIFNQVKARVVEIYSGLWMLREEAPLRFCVTMSAFFISMAILGVKVSTPLLIYSLVISAFALPPALIALSRNEKISPALLFVGEIILSLSNLLVYHGCSAPKQESNYLEDFLPDASAENLNKLDITLKSTKTETEDLSLLLAPDQSIPSHEEVDLLALPHADLETDLLPPASIEHDLSDGDDDIEAPVGRLAGVDDSDTDSADGAFSLTDKSINLSSYLPAVSSAAEAYLPTVSLASAYLPSASTVSQVLGSLVSPQTDDIDMDRNLRSGSEPNLDDFELISEEDLDKVSP